MARPKKVTAQSRLSVQSKYDAAGSGRRMRGWSPPTSGPNKAIVGLQNIRNRARDAERNDWSGESAHQKWTTALIGTGIVPRFKRVKSKTRRDEIINRWNRWVRKSDADCVLNFYGQQTLAVRTWLSGGECFVRKRVRRLDSGLAVPLQVQLIEAEFCPLFDADQWPGMPAGNVIRSGIEFDRRRQRVAYWMHREHPGDGGLTSTSNLLRIPASEVLHIFEPKRAGQLRGVSALAPVLARLRSIGDYDDAVLERQKLANLFVAFIKRGLNADADVDPLTGLAFEKSGSDTLAGLAPGLIQVLDDGEDVTFSNPPEAGTTYSDYMRTQNMGTAAATGMPYEVFSGDIKEVSDRTLRVLINEFRRFAEQRQWQIVIPMLCEGVMAWWAETAMLAGVLTEDEVEPVEDAEWSPHGWAHIHPVQDPQGKKLEVDAGFRSRSSVIGGLGEDPDAVDDERAADVQREKDLDLWVDPNPQPAEAPQDDTAAADAEEARKEMQALFAAFTRMEARMEASLQQRPEPAAAPVVNNHITLPEQAAPVTNNTINLPEQAAPVVNNTVNVPEQPAPVVNNTVNVPEQPAPVVNNVQTHPARAVQRVERDAQGDILQTVITYEHDPKED